MKRRTMSCVMSCAHTRAIADGGKDNAAGHLDLKIRERRGDEIVVGYSTMTEFVPPKTRGRWLDLPAAGINR
jgi:hypothetical protein